MEICKCSETVRANWGSQKESWGLSCLFCNKKIEEAGAVAISTLMESYGDGSPAATVKAKPAPKVATKSAPATLDDVVAAQNRTTHAVRAFVRFLFIQLSAITAGLVVLNFADQAYASRECIQYGNCGGADAMSIFGVLIIIGGVIASSNAGWSELHKSDIPD